MVESKDVATWKLGPPALLAEVDFSKPFETWLAARAELTVARDTPHLGIVLAFRAKLAEGIVLSTLPGQVSKGNHWAYALFPALGHPALAKGDKFEIEYSYDRGVTMVNVLAS
jgi:hypothetical protein